MSDENIERRMEFIIEQQANFVVDIAKLNERMDKLVGIAETLIGQMSQLVGSLAQLTELTKTGFTNLIDNSQKHDEQIAALIEQGKETDARLNALITMVERHISRHDGK